MILINVNNKRRNTRSNEPASECNSRYFRSGTDLAWCQPRPSSAADLGALLNQEMRDDMDMGQCNGGLFADSREIPAAQVTSVQRAVAIIWTMPTTMQLGYDWFM